MKRWNTIIGCVILVLLMLSQAVFVSAAEIQNGSIYPIYTNSIAGWPQGMDTYSETAVLMEAETGTVLYNKGMNELRYPASITKIMTAMLAIEHSNMEEQVIFTDVCLADQTPDSGNAGMKVGEILTMKQCLLVLMIKSANDVATQIAEHVGGTVENFVDMMNQRAKEIGCTNTHFVNASGMPDEDHYTTAYDMALIFQEAIKSPVFREIISTLSVTIGPTNMNSEVKVYSTHHALLAPEAPEHYEGCFGGKTGTTNISRNTLVSGAERNGMTLIAVALRADAGQVCQDHINLFDYGYNNFEKKEISGGWVVVPKGTETSSLNVVDDTLTGESNYYYNDYYVGRGTEENQQQDEENPIELLPEENDTASSENEISLSEETVVKNDDFQNNYRWIIYILVGFIVLALIVTFLSASSRKRSRKRRRRKKRMK